MTGFTYKKYRLFISTNLKEFLSVTLFPTLFVFQLFTVRRHKNESKSDYKSFSTQRAPKNVAFLTKVFSSVNVNQNLPNLFLENACYPTRKNSLMRRLGKRKQAKY